MATINQIPRTFVVNSIVWTDVEVQGLKDLYGGRPFVEMTMRDIRSNVHLQKAMNADAIVASSFNHSQGTAILQMGQIGLDLIGLL